MQAMEAETLQPDGNLELLRTLENVRDVLKELCSFVTDFAPSAQTLGEYQSYRAEIISKSVESAKTLLGIIDRGQEVAISNEK